MEKNPEIMLQIALVKAVIVSHNRWNTATDNDWIHFCLLSADGLPQNPNSNFHPELYMNYLSCQSKK